MKNKIIKIIESEKDRIRKLCKCRKHSDGYKWRHNVGHDTWCCHDDIEQELDNILEKIKSI